MHPPYPAQLVAGFFQAKAAAYISPMAVKAMQDQGADNFILVDVRPPGPHLTWRIPGTVAMPASALAKRLGELPKDKLIVVYCYDTWCSLATTAALVLLDKGYRVKELYGGVAAWQSLRLPQQTNIGEAATGPVCAC